MRRGGQPDIVECTDNRQGPACSGGTGIELLGLADAFHRPGTGATVQLLGPLRADGGDTRKRRSSTVHASQGDVVGQNESEASVRQQILGRADAAERIHCSKAPIMNGGARHPDQERVRGAGTAQGRADDSSQAVGASLQRLLGRFIVISRQCQEPSGIQEPGACLSAVPVPRS